MRNRLSALILSLLMALSLAACAAEEGADGTDAIGDEVEPAGAVEEGADPLTDDTMTDESMMTEDMATESE